MRQSHCVWMSWGTIGVEEQVLKMKQFRYLGSPRQINMQCLREVKKRISRVEKIITGRELKETNGRFTCQLDGVGFRDGMAYKKPGGGRNTVSLWCFSQLWPVCMRQALLYGDNSEIVWLLLAPPGGASPLSSWIIQLHFFQSVQASQYLRPAVLSLNSLGFCLVLVC